MDIRCCYCLMERVGLRFPEPKMTQGDSRGLDAAAMSWGWVGEKKDLCGQNPEEHVRENK